MCAELRDGGKNRGVRAAAGWGMYQPRLCLSHQQDSAEAGTQKDGQQGLLRSLQRGPSRHEDPERVIAS